MTRALSDFDRTADKRPAGNPLPIVAILLAALAPLTMDAKAQPINTACGWQDSPFVSLDGQRLIFTYTPFNFTPIFQQPMGLPELSGPTRQGHHSNEDPFQDTDNYLVGRSGDGSWRAQVIVNFPFNTNTSDCCGMEYSDRGENKFLYLRAEPLLPNSGVFYESTLRGGAWSEPQVIGAGELYDPDAVDDNPHIIVLPDGKAMLAFASSRSGGHGGKDLYVSTRPAGGEWAPPMNMGPNINTNDTEDQPWLSPDGRTLFFARGNQIFESSKSGTDWLPAWHVPLGNLQLIGEPSLTADLQEMYFLSIDNTTDRWETSIMRSRRNTDGSWGLPEPVD